MGQRRSSADQVSPTWMGSGGGEGSLCFSGIKPDHSQAPGRLQGREVRIVPRSRAGPSPTARRVSAPGIVSEAWMPKVGWSM
jgi:hypothetical protein